MVLATASQPPPAALVGAAAAAAAGVHASLDVVLKKAQRIQVEAVECARDARDIARALDMQNQQLEAEVQQLKAKVAEEQQEKKRWQRAARKAQAVAQPQSPTAGMVMLAQLKKARKERDSWRKKVRTLQKSVPGDKRALKELTAPHSKMLAKLLLTHADKMHPDQKYLKELIKNQLSVLSKKSRRCVWHPAVLEFASAIYTSSPSAYAEAVAAGILALPSMEYIKRVSKTGSTVGTGKDPTLAKRFGAELDKWGVPEKERDLCLIWDEVNLVGQLAFRVVGNKYHFMGIVDDTRHASCFKPKAGKKPKTLEEDIRALKATHILVLQAVCLFNLKAYSNEKAVRRTVGMFSVANMVAEQADEIVWFVIACLQLYALACTRCTTCDGASNFRLLQKSNTSGQGRGTPNNFYSSAVVNDCVDPLVDSQAQIFLSSDVSHWGKKGIGNWYSSAHGNTSRDMALPDYLVQLVLLARPQPGMAAQASTLPTRTGTSTAALTLTLTPLLNRGRCEMRPWALRPTWWSSHGCGTCWVAPPSHPTGLATRPRTCACRSCVTPCAGFRCGTSTTW